MSSLSSPSSTYSLFYSAPPSPPDGPFPTANDKHDVSGLGGPRGIKAYLRFANTVFVKGSLVTAAGLTLPVQLNLRALGVESAALAAWVVDGRVSVAAVPCDKCRALEYHRPEGNRPLPCLVRSASNRSDGENCVLCKVKRQSCCAELRAPNTLGGEGASGDASQCPHRGCQGHAKARGRAASGGSAQGRSAGGTGNVSVGGQGCSSSLRSAFCCGGRGEKVRPWGVIFMLIRLSSPDGRHCPPYSTSLVPSPPADLYAKARQPSSGPPFLV